VVSAQLPPLPELQQKIQAAQQYDELLQTKQTQLSIPETLYDAEMAVDLALADVDNIRLMLMLERRLLENHINQMDGMNDRAALTLAYEQRDLQSAQVATLQRALYLARDIYQKTQDNLGHLQQDQFTAQAQERSTDRSQHVEILSKQLSDLDQRILQQREKLKEASAAKIQTKDLQRLSSDEEQRQYLVSQLTVLQFDPMLDELQAMLTQQDGGLFSLRYASDYANFLLDSLQEMQFDLQAHLARLSERLAHLTKEFEAYRIGHLDYMQQKQHIQALLKGYQLLSNDLQSSIDEVTQYRSTIAQSYGMGLMARQPLPSDAKEWKTLLSELLSIPLATWQKMQQNTHQVSLALQSAGLMRQVILVVAELCWLFVCFRLWRALKRYQQKNIVLKGKNIEAKRFSEVAWFVVTQITSRNLYGLAFFGAVIGLLVLSTVSGESLSILVGLGLIWFVFKMVLGVAHIALLENAEDVAGRDVILYRHLRAGLSISIILAALTLLTHYLSISFESTAFIDRLFMLVLLGVSVPLLKSKDVVPDLLEPYFGTRQYLRRMVRLLAVLIPLTIFSNAALGLMGYVNLAWRIAVIEAQILCGLSILLLLRGLFRDGMTILSEWCIRYLSNGWLWMEAILKPMQKLLYLLLLWLIIWGLLYWILAAQTLLMFQQQLWLWINHPLFSIADAPISTLSLIEFFIVLSLVIWAAKWSREFSYRWLFSQSKDPGVRNSLSVFLQYGTVMIGVFLILRVLGLDITTLTVVLGAMAVGLGFGLRDIANNFVSGVLLLIERPIRKGDVIKIGEHEGEVTHIGMRAVTMHTSESVDVLVPNASIFSQAFSNWTHTDSLIRTLFTLRVDFGADPHAVQQMIQEVVTSHPSVMHHPAVEVFLQEIGESALIFQIRYHTDLRTHTSRTKVKSEVIFKVWDALKTAGIRSPYPQQDIHLHKE